MNKKNAFTLTELLIVVIITGILLGVSLPHFRPTFDNLELENFVKDIFYLSRYLQGTSISQGKIYCLNVDKESGEFWATAKEESGFKEIKGRLGNKYKTPSGVIITIEPEGKNETYFYPDGSADKITLTFENRHKNKNSLMIKGAAGGIEIQ